MMTMLDDDDDSCTVSVPIVSGDSYNLAHVGVTFIYI